MSKFKKLTALLLCAAMLVAALMSGCTGNGGESSKEESKPDDGSILGQTLKYDTNAEVNNGEDITITFWYPDDVTALVTTWVKNYTDMHANVTIKTEEFGWDDYWEKLPVAIQGGTGPDFFWMHNAYTDTMADLTEAYPEAALPVDALKADFRNVDLHLVDGKLYYIDVGLMSSVIVYNKDMWTDAGLSDADIPKTWDEFVAVAKKLTKKDGANFTVQGFNLSGDNNFVSVLQAMNYQKGYFQFAEDGKGSLYNNDAVTANMEYIKSMFTGDDAIGTYNADDLDRQLFADGKSAMLYAWTWIPGWLKGEYPDLNVGYFALPSFDGNPAAFDRFNGEATPCVSNKGSDANKAVAFDFLKYLLANDGFAKEFALNNGVFPGKYSLDDDADIKNSVLHQTMLKTIDKCVWPGPTPSAIEGVQKSYLQDDFMINGKSAAESAAKADTEVAKSLSQLNFTPVERRYEGASSFKN